MGNWYDRFNVIYIVIDNCRGSIMKEWKWPILWGLAIVSGMFLAALLGK